MTARVARVRRAGRHRVGDVASVAGLRRGVGVIEPAGFMKFPRMGAEAGTGVVAGRLPES